MVVVGRFGNIMATADSPLDTQIAAPVATLHARQVTVAAPTRLDLTYHCSGYDTLLDNNSLSCVNNF
jgi:hypothetical protein